MECLWSNGDLGARAGGVLVDALGEAAVRVVPDEALGDDEDVAVGLAGLEGRLAPIRFFTPFSCAPPLGRLTAREAAMGMAEQLYVMLLLGLTAATAARSSLALLVFTRGQGPGPKAFHNCHGRDQEAPTCVVKHLELPEVDPGRVFPGDGLDETRQGVL